MTTEHHACPDCRGGEFWLMPDGRIICADDDCYRPQGWWKRPAEDDAVAGIKLTDGVLTIGLAGLAAIRIDTARRMVAIDGISGSLPDGERTDPAWTVADLRDGTYGGFHRLKPAAECFDADCSAAGEHEDFGEPARQPEGA